MKTAMPVGRSSLVLCLFLALVGGGDCGWVLLGGDDFPDHGYYDESSGEFHFAWKFVSEALALAVQSVSIEGLDGNGTVYILGTREGDEPDLDSGYSSPGDCYHYVCKHHGFDCKFIDGRRDVEDTLEGIDDGTIDDASVLVIGGDEYGKRGDNFQMDTREEGVINDLWPVLTDFVDRGGSLISHTHGYDWLEDALDIGTSDDCDSSGATLTDASQVYFHTLSHEDVQRRGESANAECHNTFRARDVEKSVFVPLVRDSEDRVFSMIARGSVFALETIRLNCSQATAESGTWTLRFDDAGLDEDVSFSISRDIPVGTGGDQFVRILEDMLSTDDTFTNELGCSVSHPGSFQATCARGTGFKDTQICFRAAGDDADEEECDDLAGHFVMNGLRCPVPPCKQCPEVVDPVEPQHCDQLGRPYPSLCHFNLAACEFPGDSIQLRPCNPGEEGEVADDENIDTNGGSSGLALSIGGIVGIILSILVCCGLAVGAFFWRRKQHLEPSQLDDEQGGSWLPAWLGGGAASGAEASPAADAEQGGGVLSSMVGSITSLWGASSPPAESAQQL